MAKGAFDNLGRPVIDIILCGSTLSLPVAAQIDTGFSGFVRIPVVEITKAGLSGQGVTPVQYANEVVENSDFCIGTVWLDNEEQEGIILIDSCSSQALVGMTFLLKFRKRLSVDIINDIVELLPCD